MLIKWEHFRLTFRRRREMMRHTPKILVAILATLLVFHPVLSWAGSGARVIPQGKVSLLENGKEATQFQSEIPLPEGSLMLCNGNCLVQTSSLQLVAQDRSVFALAEGKARWDLTVKFGQVDFVMRPDANPISFHTPHDLIQTERAIVPASSTGMIRGYITVTESESVLALQEGTLQVMSPDGTVLVEPGQGIRLAQAQVAPAAPAAGAGGAAAEFGTAWTVISLGAAAVAIGVPAGFVATSGGSTSVSGH
jgi:hypothetical protein